MKEIILKCKVITPLFIGGAEQQAELRTQSIKGLIRWFWRAIRCENDIKELKREEAEIFGDNNIKSKVKIQLIFKTPGVGKNIKYDFKLQWSYDKKNRSLKGTHRGLGYLLYSTVLPGREREYIKPDTEFKLKISSFYEDALNQALAALWAVVYLGGLGTRSRRGGGNLEVIKTEGDSKIDFFIKGKNSEEVANWITENFNKVIKIISNSKDKNTDFAFEYSNLSFSRFIISRERFKNWIDALNDIGEKYYSFRFEQRSDIFDMGSFGLPVKHSAGFLKSKKYNRRSSPIIIKILKSEGKFYWFVLRLFGKFLEEGDVLEYKGKTQKPDYKAIDEFWNELKKFGNEYILNTPKILDEIINKIKTKLNPSKICIFGSRARGDAYKKSDIDIAVETDIPLEKLEINAPVDLVDMKKVDKYLKEKIERERVLLYERKG